MTDLLEQDGGATIEVHKISHSTRYAFYCCFTANTKKGPVRSWQWIPRNQVKDAFLYYDGQEDCEMELSAFLAERWGILRE